MSTTKDYISNSKLFNKNSQYLGVSTKKPISQSVTITESDSAPQL
jgi:hypothetical protein